MCGAKGYVRLAPNSDRESGFPHKVMSALPLKADICSGHDRCPETKDRAVSSVLNQIVIDDMA